MNKFFIPFRTGDVVKIVKKQHVGWNNGKPVLEGKLGQVHIIESFDIDGQEYSTDHGAWYAHSMFELVRPCDQKSLKKLYKAHAQEYEE